MRGWADFSLRGVDFCTIGQVTGTYPMKSVTGGAITEHESPGTSPRDEKGIDAQVSTEVTLHYRWRQALPQWDRFSDLVPVAGHSAVKNSPPEVRTEVVLEAATALHNARGFTIGDLYPLVPDTFIVDLGKLGGLASFSSIRETPVPQLSQRSNSALGVHQSLAQVTAAVASAVGDLWPKDECLRQLASALFRLPPEDFYLVVDVHLLGRDRRVADQYYSEYYDNDLDLVLPHAVADVADTMLSEEFNAWLNELIAFPQYWRQSHPQLFQNVGPLDFTVADLVKAMYPDMNIGWGIITR